MTSAITLRIIIALALVALVTQAVPISSIDAASDPNNLASDPACSQNVDSGSASLGSTVNTVPITNVTPINRYQPVIQAFAPIVQSECGQDDGLDPSLETENSNTSFGPSYNSYDNSIPRSGYESDCGSDYGSDLGSTYSGSDCGSDGQFYRRDDASSDLALDNFSSGLTGSSLLSSDSSLSDSAADQQPGCDTSIPDQSDSNFNQCQQSDWDTSIPQQGVDLGSDVNAIPSTDVLPSTIYQPDVNSLESDIQASPAQSSDLPQQNVNLGSNVSIEPTTQVLSQTTYQPQVQQLATSIEASAQQDQSLPQSSVQLGSNVQITPTVRVQPSTLYQPRIQSFPFVIDVQPCDDSSSSSSSGYGYDTFQRPRFFNPYYSRPLSYGSLTPFETESSNQGLYQSSSFDQYPYQSSSCDQYPYQSSSCGQYPYQSTSS
ncbi:hypothetical protein BGZ46_008700 [Entomortierella lignicola]|nr:hypothetical protein BGZ46_008700 [Entomortierella lignicola]